MTLKQGSCEANHRGNLLICPFPINVIAVVSWNGVALLNGTENCDHRKYSNFSHLNNMLLNTVVGTWIIRPLGTFIDHDVSHYVMSRLQLFSYMSRLILDRLVS